MLRFASWRLLAALSGILLLAACSEEKQEAAAAPPKPVAPQVTNYAVYFDTNKSNLKSDGQATVQHVSSDFHRDGAGTVTIVGKADTVGSAKSNMALSEARANQVRDALIATGVPASNIHTSWTGEEQLPVQTANHTAEGQNRVVQIKYEAPATAQAPVSGQQGSSGGME